jgi:plastocyanin
MRSFRVIVALATLSAYAGAAIVAQDAPARGGISGTLRGRVDVKSLSYSLAPRPSASEPGRPSIDRLPRQIAVVYFQIAPSGAFEQSDEIRPMMDQRNETFVPHVLAIHTGTTVEFPNSDQIFHNVFSLSKTKRFDLGRYAAGRSKAVRFDSPGIVRVFCDIHSHMNAFVLVFAHRYFAVADEDGRYRIDQIPPGSYAVTAWYEGSDRDTRPIVIPPGGGVVEQDFVVR